MIDIASLKEEDTRKWVIYDNGYTKEKGRIKSWSAHLIFVVYKCANKWDNFQDYTGCATQPGDLSFIKYIEETRNGKIRFEIKKEIIETITL